MKAEGRPDEAPNPFPDSINLEDVDSDNDECVDKCT